MRRWAPFIWILIYVASIFILNGGHPGWDTGQLIAGIALAMIAFVASMYLAFAPSRDEAGPGALGWLVAGVGVFYVVTAIAAWIFAGAATGIATLLAAIVPATAVAALVAATRAKTVTVGDGTAIDAARGAGDDESPAMGVDDQRPFGDSPEVHNTVTPHDLPLDHPGRKAAEQQAEALEGTTPGHREGGATDTESRFSRDAASDLVGEDEKDGARVSPEPSTPPLREV